MTRIRTKLLVLPATAATAVAISAGALAAAGPATALSVHPCSGAVIRTRHSIEQGAAGHGYVTFRFRNISQSTCSLRGYPGLDALGPRGHVLRSAKRTVGATPGVRTIILHSWQVASAYAEWLNFNPVTTGPCRFSASVAVTPPNTFATKHFPLSVSVCRLQIHPVVKGLSGI